MLKINKKSKKSLLIVAALLVVVLGGGYYLYDGRIKGSDATAQPTGKVNLNPPTEQEKQSSEQNKQAIDERERRLQSQPSTTGKKSVKPVITYGGQYGSQIEVGGYVPGIFEDTGTCTAKFTNGSRSFAKSVQAIKNVSSTDCPVMSAGNAEFSPKGSWSVVISYDSPAASGTSDSKGIEVK